MHGLLGDVWIIGEDSEYKEALAKVVAAEQQPISTWEDLLRLAMMYHQVQAALILGACS